jgi:type I restriction enzyme S subunit
MAGEWSEMTLGDAIELKRGYDLPSRDRRDGPFPIVSSSGISGHHTEAKAKAPGVVIGRYGTLGEVHYITKDYWPLNTALYVRDFKGNDPRFVSYFLRSLDFTAYSDKAAVPGLNRNDLHTAQVLLPPLPEQRAIAHILGTLDDKIELNRRMSETLEAMARALFKSWFVDFDPVRAKAEGRDPGLPQPLADLFPDSFEDSELGEIPRGWVVATLGELIDTIKGRSYRSEELIESDTALVTLKSFARGGGYRPDGLKSFAGTFKPEQVVEPGELVIACTDVTQAAEVIGRPAIVRGTGVYRRLVASLDTLIVRPRGSSMTRSFLYFLAGTEAFVAHTFAHTTGTTVLHLAKEAVPSFMFARPSTELVKQFDALARLVLDRIQALEEESVTLAALRDALLPKLISGELRVRDAEKVVARAGP